MEVDTESSRPLTDPVGESGQQGTLLRGPIGRTLDRLTPSDQAFQILRAGFVAAPIIAGLDKFPQMLTDWDRYLAPAIERRLPVSGRTFMRAVGVVEVGAGLLTALRPRLGGYVVAAWLGAIIGNLLIGRRSYDVALRDFGLMLGATALARLASGKRAGLPASSALH